MSSFEERALARATWRIKETSLGDEEPMPGPSNPTEAWNAVLELSREAYAAMGVVAPALPRSQWPARLFRPGEPRPDSNGL